MSSDQQFIKTTHTRHASIFEARNEFFDLALFRFKENLTFMVFNMPIEDIKRYYNIKSRVPGNVKTVERIGYLHGVRKEIPLDRPDDMVSYNLGFGTRTVLFFNHLDISLKGIDYGPKTGGYTYRVESSAKEAFEGFSYLLSKVVVETSVKLLLERFEKQNAEENKWTEIL